MKIKVLAVASGGGHWKQLMVLSESFGENVHYVTTIDGLPQQEKISAFSIVKDCNKENLYKSFSTIFNIYRIIRRERPQIIISTGAAPGLIAIFIGRIIFRKKCIWIDSIANSEKLSLAGRLAKFAANEVLTQWEHLKTEKVNYHGGIY